MSLGKQVFGNLRLGEIVLVRGDRGRALRSRGPTGHADLRVPHRSELVRSHRSRRRHLAFADLARGGFASHALTRGSLASNDFARRSLTGFALARFARRLARPAVASAATTAASPTATRGIDILSTLGGLNVSDFARNYFARVDLARKSLIGELFARSLTGVGGSGELLAGESHEPTTRSRRRPAGRNATRGSLGTRRGHNRFLDRVDPSGSTSASSATAPAAATLGQLVRDLRHREIFVVTGDSASGARGVVVHAGHLCDVVEGVCHLDQIRAGVAPEADYFDADSHFLDRTDGWRKVPIATDDDRDVQVSGRLHHVDDKLDVEVRLDLAVAVLANVLAHDFVAVTGKEGMEVALILVVGIQTCVCIGPHEVSPGNRCLQQRHVVDVRAGCLGRVEDVRHVYEDGDVFTHE
jgi:hypothetical protein